MRVRQRNEAFSTSRKEQTATDIAAHWPESATKADCERYILQTEDTALPSVCIKTAQAMHCLKGHRAWRTVVLKPDTSDLTPEDKVEYMKAAHAKDLSHVGGRDSLLSVLKNEKVSWNRMHLDCQFFVDRCDTCRLQTSREKIEAPLRHLPSPNSAGDCLGWDIKTVVPTRSTKWHMLVCVDFCSHKVWAWDFAPKQCTLKNVQSTILRFFAEHELPSVTWSDNGGQFTGVITKALYNATGCQSRTIPPGRPESNGLTEKYNHLLDLTHHGDRSKLLTAVIALNNRQVPGLGYSPEQLWRLLRPKTSRWEHAHLRATIYGDRDLNKARLTDAQWQEFLDTPRLDGPELQKRADALAASVVPVQRAIDCRKLRLKMQRQLRWSRRRSQKSSMALLSGDRVVARATQYVSKTAPTKFESREGQIREFTVLHSSQGFVHLQDDSTGEKVLRHEAFLKPMPRSLPPEDQQMPTPDRHKSAMADLMLCGVWFLMLPAFLSQACSHLTYCNSSSFTKTFQKAFLPCYMLPGVCLSRDTFQVVKAATDGACLFRALSMGMKARSGIGTEFLLGDKA